MIDHRTHKILIEQTKDGWWEATCCRIGDEYNWRTRVQAEGAGISEALALLSMKFEAKQAELAAKPEAADTSHIRFHPQTGSMFCAHCGAKHDLHLPQPIGAISALSKWFEGEHADCKPVKPVCGLCLRIGHIEDLCPKLSPKTPDEWYHGPDSGVSSKVICGVATGSHYIPCPASTPQDPGDFGRCYRLLKLFPWMREHLSDVALAYPAWHALVAHWDELTRLYEEGLPSGQAPKLAKRLDELNARFQ